MELMIAETAADIEKLGDLVRRWESVNNARQLGLQATTQEEMLNNLKMIIATGGCVLVLMSGHKPLGVMAAVVSGELLIERFLYMVNFAFMARLVDGMRQWGASKGCKTLIFNSTNISDKKRARVERLFFLHGAVEYARSYTMRCNNG